MPLSGEDGAVIVTFAISLVLLMLLASFAVDASNFFRHKRQLQNQADASVLAGASKLSAGCADSSAVLAEATKYAGIPGATYNKPKSAPDSGTLSAEWVTGDPCAEGALEVRITETGTKWFFPITAVAGAVRADLDISASARVELKQIQGQGGAIPIAVEEEQRIIGAWVWLVDEAVPDVPIPGTVKLLVEGADAGDATPWTTATPISHAVKSSDLGIRVGVDRGKTSSCIVAAVTCATASCLVAKVTCYDAGSAKGLLHIHGYEQVPDVTSESPPALENVEITPNAPCVGNAYFNSAGCTYTVTAEIDWVTEVDGGTVGEADDRATVTGTVGGSSVTLRPVANTRTWVGATGTITDTTPANVRLAWTQRHGMVAALTPCGRKTNSGGQITSNPGGANTPICRGAWNGTAALGVSGLAISDATPVHRLFVRSTDRSGPITFASVTEGGLVANSLKRCTLTDSICPERQLSVRVDLPAELKVGSKRTLTTKAPGSEGGHLDCDPLNQDTSPNRPNGGGEPLFIYQLAYGCNGPRYQVNPGDSCPAVTSYGANEPWVCVAGVPGEMTQALDRGLSQRVYGTTSPTPAQCAARAPTWPNFSEDDPRIVSVMIVSSGSIGTSTYPIRVFAYFYLLGWGANKQMDHGGGCTNNELAAQGSLIGRFIHHTVDNTGGVFGTRPCDATQLGGCVPVMTK